MIDWNPFQRANEWLGRANEWLGRGYRYLTQLPVWALLRLSTVTGRKPGWWVMTLTAATVGALSAALTVGTVHAYLRARETATAPVRVQSVSSGARRSERGTETGEEDSVPTVIDV